MVAIGGLEGAGLEAAIAEVRTRLIANNLALTGPVFRRDVSTFARDGETVIGGAVGRIWGQTLWVEMMWVDGASRGTGIGSQLMADIEAKARAEGAVQAGLDTFSFGARGFYEKLGYAIFGTVTDYFPGQDRFYMLKAL